MSKTLFSLLTVCAFIVGFVIGMNTFDYNYGDYVPIEINLIEEDKAPSYQYLKSVTTVLELDSKDCLNNQCGEGTGVIVKVDDEYTYILTNAHVAGYNEDLPTVFVKEGERQLEAEIVGYHNTLDLALIKLTGVLDGKQAVVGISEAKPSDKVYVVGNNLSRGYVYGEGVFAGYQDKFDVIQLPIAPGNSGSGVINEDGELVGIFAGTTYINMIQLQITHGLAINGHSIQLFLKQYGVL